ncbi:MAG: arylesterase [Alphaproteobacteria bacterium]
MRIVALGDSLTAGYGLKAEDGFTARLQAALRAKGLPAEVVNAGVSGDTSAGGLARINSVVKTAPDVVIVELGSNDGLRGLDPDVTFGNLDALLARLDEAGVKTLLAGTLAPPNLGREYGDEFDAVFPRLARKHDVAFYPFFLDGVAADPALNQQDGLHPNAEGVRRIVAGIMPHLLPLVERAKHGD